MNNIIEKMLEKYDLKTSDDFENGLKEIIQHLALLGLWRSKFFEHAAFYGGTALRIFYGLRRFSEDMDFSLIKKDKNFNLDKYTNAIKKEIESFGFIFQIEKKYKILNSTIESAFLKGNSIKNLISINTPEDIIVRFQQNKKLKIKIEVDIDPPDGAGYEVKTLFNPIPFQVKLFNLKSLFAGKCHAIICRNWKSRIKGRDYYDFLWYIGGDISCDIDHLRLRMIQSGHLQKNEKLNYESLKKKLKEKITTPVIKQAIEDVKPFIKDQDELSLWGKDLFLQAIERLKVI